MITRARLVLLLLLLLLGFLAASTAHARVERFGVIVGNNQGGPDDTPLRYAEADAARVHDVLLQLGDFSPLNLVLLRGQDAGQVRRALLTINERIRDLREDPSVEVVLVIYYSGHADAQDLRLSGTRLGLSELRQHARGSSANFRLVILDACRSGSLTRVKGGRRAPALALAEGTQERLPGNGIAFLTASSASEDAQESDALRGAFFTHALVSGLLGAADADGDGVVVLDEAYRYAYASTLRATSRTFAGTQHPTFQYGLRGRGRVVLTRPRAHRSGRARVVVPTGHGYLFMQDHADGQVVAELTPSRAARELSLAPGRYFVRVRAPDALYEGTVDARPGHTTTIALAALTRIDYARLVRKGGRVGGLAHGPEAGLSIRTALPNASDPCAGAFVDYGLELNRFGLRARLTSCTAELRAQGPTATLWAHDMELSAHHAWDISPFTLQTGVGLGLSLFDQDFEPGGSARDQTAIAPFLTLDFGVKWNLRGGFYVGLSLDGQTHFLKVIEAREPDGQTLVAFAVRTGLGVGKYF